MNRSASAENWLKICVQTYQDDPKEMWVMGTSLHDLTVLELKALVAYLQRERERERLKRRIDGLL